jgi:hypothetical protein
MSMDMVTYLSVSSVGGRLCESRPLVCSVLELCWPRHETAVFLVNRHLDKLNQSG